MKHKETEDENYIITLEAPHSRSMDKSPNALAAEMDCVTNTIKKRINDAGLNFKIPSDSNYQLFNYECLPILKAYINVERWKESSREDVPSFLKRLSEELAANPDQEFCKEFLYNTPQFQKFLLQSKFYEPISQRLKLIKKQAVNLTIRPIIQAKEPFFPLVSLDILSALDKIIYTLSNYVESDSISLSTHTPNQSSALKSITATNLVNSWCNKLIEKRKALSPELDKGRIILNIPEGSSESEVKSALNTRLINETLSETEHKHAMSLDSIFNMVKQQECIMAEIRSCKASAISDQLIDLMAHNVKRYLDAIFTGNPAPQFESPAPTHLNSMLISTIKEWYEQFVFLLLPFEHIISTTLVVISFTNPQELFLNENAHFHIQRKLNAQLKPTSHILSIWTVMEECSYIPSKENWLHILPNIIDSATVSNSYFGTLSHKYDITSAFTALLQDTEASLPLEQMIALSSITLETFLDKHLNAYADYFTKIFAEYQKCLTTEQ